MPITRRSILAAAALSATAIATKAMAASNTPIRLTADTAALYRNIFAIGLAGLARTDPALRVEIAWTRDYTETLQQSLRDKLVGNGPDIGLHAHNNIAMLARRGDVVALAGAASDHIASPIGRIEGRQFGIPFTCSVPVVYINRSLVAGSDRQPASWDDVLALAATSPSPSRSAFFNFATDGSWTFMALIESLGGRIVDGPGTDIAFNTAEGLEAMEILGAFAKLRKGDMLTASQARQAFSSGALAVHVDTTSRLRFFEEQAKGKFDLDVAPFPLKNNGQARIPPSGGSLAIMTAEPSRQTDAWRIIRSLLSREVQMEIMNKTGFIPGLAVFGSDPTVKAALAATPHFQAIAPSLAVLGPWASFPVDNPARADKAVQDALADQAALKTTAKQTLSRIVTAVRNG